MQDIMAIYIIYLTEENIDYLYQDIKNQIFDNFCINIVFYDTQDTQNSNILNNFYQKVSSLENNNSISS